MDRDYFFTQQISVTNLPPGTLLHLRVVVTNSAGTIYGNDLAVMTPAPATAVTLPANYRKTTSATLNAAVTINGLSTSACFEWGATTNYGQVTAVQSLGNAFASVNVVASITGLTAQTAYHCRAVVFSSGVTNNGSDVVFSTTPPSTNLVVTNLMTDDVRGAIERGGAVTFACDGVVLLTNRIEIANDVCLDATGHAITLSGGNATRIFRVLPGTLLTLTNGTNGYGSGGSIANTGGVFQIVNSILSGGTSANAFGVITDLGHNLSSDATPAWTSGTSLNNTDPLLLPLANNGGPTLTMALRVGSPALNTADPAASPATDQRGSPRPSGPGDDIGAYEGPGTPTALIARVNNQTNLVRAVAETGRTHRLEKTANFTGWLSVQTNSVPLNGYIEFRVPANPSPCFFRIVAQ